MAKIFNVSARAGISRLIDPIGRTLLRAGVSPNAVTVAGTVGVLAGAIAFGARGQFVAAVIVITLCAFTDLIDGSMARARGVPSRFGALLDSTMDRVADGAVFGVVAYYYGVHGNEPTTAAALLCLVAGQVVSYVKARAEGLGLTCNVGIAERAERLILVGVGGLLTGFGLWEQGLPVALWILAALSLITIGQRIAHVQRQDSGRRQDAVGDAPAGGAGA